MSPQCMPRTPSRRHRCILHCRYSWSAMSCLCLKMILVDNHNTYNWRWPLLMRCACHLGTTDMHQSHSRFCTFLFHKPNKMCRLLPAHTLGRTALMRANTLRLSIHLSNRNRSLACNVRDCKCKMLSNCHLYTPPHTLNNSRPQSVAHKHRCCLSMNPGPALNNLRHRHKKPATR